MQDAQDVQSDVIGGMENHVLSIGMMQVGGLNSGLSRDISGYSNSSSRTASSPLR